MAWPLTASRPMRLAKEKHRVVEAVFALCRKRRTYVDAAVALAEKVDAVGGTCAWPEGRTTALAVRRAPGRKLRDDRGGEFACRSALAFHGGPGITATVAALAQLDLM